MGRFWRTLRKHVKRLRVHWRRFASSARGKRILWIARQILTVSVAGYLVYRMSMIGWGEIWHALPRNPWFYVVFLVIYLLSPGVHALSFRLIWGERMRRLLPAMLKKRVYDRDVLDRSGDVYVYFWGRRHVDHTDRELLHHVKDNAIASAGAATLIALLLLATFLFLGYIPLPDAIARHGGVYGGLGGVALAALVAVGVRFRRTMFLLPARLLGVLFGLHLGRVVLQKGLYVLEWNLGLPDISLEVWFAFLAVQIITSHIPFLPSRDLVFMAAGIELAGAVEVSKAAIAGLLGVHSVLDKGLNLVAFAGVSAWERRDVARVSQVVEAGAPEEVGLTSDSDDPIVEASPPESSTAP